MMNCIAIDDEPKALEVIQRYCEKTDLANLMSIFREPIKAAAYLNHQKIDLIFLDINMPDLSGIQLLQTLAIKPMVIFTTAYSTFAVESYDFNAIDYLLKPITFERFLTAVNKASNIFSGRNTIAGRHHEFKSAFFKSGSQTYQVRVDDILFLEKDGNYIIIHLKDKEILIRENMSNIFSLIPSSEFIRVHKSYIVAIQHILIIEVQQLIVNGRRIPIGSSYRESLRNRLGVGNI
jgi:two-component system LytT family response regulator